MAKTITYNVVSDTTQAVKSQENLTDSIEETGDAMKDTKKETADYGGVIDKLTGGMASSFKGAIKGVKGLGKGFKGLRGLAMATGIGALVLLVTAAVEWFSNFDAAIRLASQAMDAIGGAVNQLGKSFDLLLKGDFSGAADAFTDVGNAALQAAENAGELYDVNIKLQELQAKNIPLNAQLRQDLELQKKILEDTTLSEKERLAALEQVTALSSTIQQNAIDENKLKRKSLELAIANENNDQKRRELNIELSQTQAELIGQEGQLNIIRKDAEKVEREINATTQQAKLDKLAKEVILNEELKASLKEGAKAKADALESIRKTLIDTEAEERAENLRLIAADYAEQIRLAELYYGEDTEKVKELKEAKRLALAEQQAEWDAIDAEKQAAKAAELLAKNNALDEIKSQKIQSNLDEEQEAADEKIAMQHKVLDDLMVIGGAETKFGKALLVAKQLLLAKEMIMDMKATLFKAQKAATDTTIAGAGAAVDIAGGAAKTAGAAPFPANIPLIVGYAATAVGIISAIRSAMKVSKAATKGVGGGGSIPNIKAPTAPSAIGGNNFFPTQIGAIPQNVPDVNATPIKAYVVASDIADSTRAQEILKQKSTF